MKTAVYQVVCFMSQEVLDDRRLIEVKVGKVIPKGKARYSLNGYSEVEWPDVEQAFELLEDTNVTYDEVEAFRAKLISDALVKIERLKKMKAEVLLSTYYYEKWEENMV